MWYILVYAVVFLHFDKSLSQPHSFAFAFAHFLKKLVNNIYRFLFGKWEEYSLKYLEYFNVWNYVWQERFSKSDWEANLNSQSSLSDAMVSPFRYDEGVTIYINGERIAPVLWWWKNRTMNGASQLRANSSNKDGSQII